MKSIKHLVVASFLSVFSVFSFSLYASAECYSYDDLGRLISVVYDNTGSAERVYTLDKHGNRTTVEDAETSGESCAVPTGVATSGSSSAADSTQYDIVDDGDTNTNNNSGTNTPPIADDEIVTLAVNTSMSVNPLEGDTDADGDALTLLSVAEASALLDATQAGDSITVNALSAVGTASFTYVVSDGNGGTSTGTVSVIITDVTLPPGDDGDGMCGGVPC